MQQIAATPNEHHWPRHEAKTIECRKRDLVVRIADWSRNREEPSFDVEVYVGGVYDWNESKTFSFGLPYEHSFPTKDAAKRAAQMFASVQIAKLL